MPFEFTTDDWNEFTKKVLEANGDQATLTTLLSDMQDTLTAFEQTLLMLIRMRSP